MDYACENASLINEDILTILLKAASFGDSLVALEKISDFKVKESIKQQVFPERFSKSHFLSSTSLEAIPLSLPPVLTIDEIELCQCLIEGDNQRLRLLLESGLSPDYLLTEDRDVNGFLCKKNCSILLLVLQACVQTNNAFLYFDILALLLEKQASLVKECLGTIPLFYICEYEDIFLEDVLLCFLTSVDKTVAFRAISKIPNFERRDHIASMLRSQQSIFQFESDCLEKQEILRIKEGLLASSFSLSVSSTLDDTIIVKDTNRNTLPFASKTSQKIIDVKGESIDFSFSRFFKKLANIVVNIEDYHSTNASINYGDKLTLLLSQIICNNFNGLEHVLQNPELLKEYNKEISSCVSDKETLLSALLHKLNNPCFKHKVCYLFLKYGLSKEEKIYQNLNLLDFLCSFRPGHHNHPSILL